MPSAQYYHRQADLCVRMALSASEYEERLRLLAIANGYRDDAARVEALIANLSQKLEVWHPSAGVLTKRSRQLPW